MKRRPNNDGLTALDALALALVEHGHVWTALERKLYEIAIKGMLAAALMWIPMDAHAANKETGPAPQMIASSLVRGNGERVVAGGSRVIIEGNGGIAGGEVVRNVTDTEVERHWIPVATPIYQGGKLGEKLYYRDAGQFDSHEACTTYVKGDRAFEADVAELVAGLHKDALGVGVSCETDPKD